MAQLEVSTFLSLTQASVDIRRFTVFIGPQAQGKSVILKLIHFFESVWSKTLTDVIPGESSLHAFKRECLERFETYFPRYAWGTDAFHIRYTEGKFEMHVSRTGRRKNNPATIHFNAAVEDVLGDAALRYRTQMDELAAGSQRLVLSRRSVLPGILDATEALAPFRTEAVFIPASRSFFANIERNIFALMSSRFELDLLVAEFGTMLESTRRNMLLFHSSSPRTKRKSLQMRRPDWNHIIGGDYVYDGEEESIENDDRVVRIANSSSGQQEAIPLLLILDYFSGQDAYSFGRHRGTVGASFFVEEPEAHLFPRAQKAIASILTESMNRHDANRVVFTTHSPYMLTAVNNLHFAGRLYKDLPPSAYSALTKIAPQTTCIPAGQLAAYKVDSGHVSSILDARSGLVNGMLIDEVSSEFAEEFDRLLTIRDQFRGQNDV